MALKRKADRVTPTQLQKEKEDHSFRVMTAAPPEADESKAIEKQERANEVESEAASAPAGKEGKVDRSREPKKNIRIEIPESVHRALRVHMITTDSSIQQYVSSLIEDSLKRKGVI